MLVSRGELKQRIAHAHADSICIINNDTMIPCNIEQYWEYH